MPTNSEPTPIKTGNKPGDVFLIINNNFSSIDTRLTAVETQLTGLESLLASI